MVKVCRIWVFEVIVGGTFLFLVFKQRRVTKKLQILIKIKIPFGIQFGIFTVLRSAKISDWCLWSGLIPDNIWALFMSTSGKQCSRNRLSWSRFLSEDCTHSMCSETIPNDITKLAFVSLKIPCYTIQTHLFTLSTNDSSISSLNFTLWGKIFDTDLRGLSLTLAHFILKDQLLQFLGATFFYNAQQFKAIFPKVYPLRSKISLGEERPS